MNARSTLADLPAGIPATVASIRSDSVVAERAQQLLDLGFAPGEAVRVLRRAAIGGDPLVVRVGASTFALRRSEARCVLVAVAVAVATS